jgi:hypothetical protein
MTGFETPEEAALSGFDPAAGATVVGVEVQNRDHVVVQVGFPGKAASYFIATYRLDERWQV